MRYCLLILMLLLLVSCGEDSSPSGSGELLINDNAAALSQRLKVYDQLLDIVDSDAAGLGLKKVAVDFELRLVAEVQSPIMGGVTLQATDVFVAGHKALVSYNIAGEPKIGAVDLIDIKDVDNLYIKSQLIFPTKDINAIHYRSNRLYLTGSAEAEVPSFVGKLRVKSGVFTEDYAELALPGYAGTDIDVSSNKILVTSGDNSGVHLLDRKAFELDSSYDLADARGVGQLHSAGDIWVVAGQPGSLHKFDKNFEFQEAFVVGGATIAESKATVQSGLRWSLATIGDGGAVLTCNEDGSVIEEIEPIVVADLDASKTVTNAAAASLSHVFTANGEAGIYVYKLASILGQASSCRRVSVRKIGHAEFGKELSANHIVFDGRYVFVADGIGGLKILTFSYTFGSSDDDIDDFDRDGDDEDEEDDFDKDYDDDEDDNDD